MDRYLLPVRRVGLANKGRICGTSEYHAFATGQHRMRSAIWIAVACGTLVESVPSWRAQYRRPVRCRTSLMRYVGPPRIFSLMRMPAGSLGKNLTLQIL